MPHPVINSLLKLVEATDKVSISADTDLRDELEITSGVKQWTDRRKPSSQVLRPQSQSVLRK